ncbi:MAG: hypothetical protein IJH75_09060 [Mogibacterium sp.]|nr:hypothetical protein [Mogibacterium sp.]
MRRQRAFAAFLITAFCILLLELFDLMTQYDLDEMAGFPFEKATTTLEVKGSLVVPCDLVTNVRELHEFLYDEADYEPSDLVKAFSDVIIAETGLDAEDAREY